MIVRLLNQLLRHFDRVTPEARRRAALVVLILSIIGWPLSALTFAADEPPAILGLSWMAVTITAIDVLLSTDIRKEQEDQ